MKRLFKILVCAIALFAFTNIAQAQQPEGKRILLHPAAAVYIVVIPEPSANAGTQNHQDQQKGQ